MLHASCTDCVACMLQVYLRNDMIIRVGELGREMYFIKSGVVQVWHQCSCLRAELAGYKQSGWFIGIPAL